MNLNLSMSSRKSRGELAAIFARLSAKNQPALLPAFSNASRHLATGKTIQTYVPGRLDSLAFHSNRDLSYNSFPRAGLLANNRHYSRSSRASSIALGAALAVPQHCRRDRSSIHSFCRHRSFLLSSQDPRPHFDLLRLVLQSVRRSPADKRAIIPFAFRSAAHLLDLPELGHHLHPAYSFRSFLLPGRRRILQEVPSLAGGGADALRRFRNPCCRARYQLGQAQRREQYRRAHHVHRRHAVHFLRPGASRTWSTHDPRNARFHHRSGRVGCVRRTSKPFGSQTAVWK